MNYAIIGSGKPNAFFTHQHIRAARALGNNLIGGVFALRDPSESPALGESLGTRGFKSIGDMVSDIGVQIDYAVVCTPNAYHFAQAQELIEAGIPVLLEKPIATNVVDANKLLASSRERKVPVTSAFTYQNFEVVSVVASLTRTVDDEPGLLGKPVSGALYYLQDWQILDLGIDQEWRQDPDISGPTNCGGDILAHKMQLWWFLTGVPITGMIAKTQVLGPLLGNSNRTRKLDDDVQALFSFGDDRFGVMKASQLFSGHLNDCRFVIAFEKGSVSWGAERPDEITISLYGSPDRVYKRGQMLMSREKAADLGVGGNLSDFDCALAGAAANANSAPGLPPGGHAKGFRGALETMHHRTGQIALKRRETGEIPPDFLGVASLEDGVRVQKCIDAMLRSRDTPFTAVES